MDYEKRFNAVRDFLAKHEYLHSVEMMDRYPKTLHAPYHAWVQEIEEFSFDELLSFEINFETSKLKNQEFVEFVNQCKELADIPALGIKERKLPDTLKRKLVPKKVHEIQTLKNYVDGLQDIKTIVDIGSGAGHLSCALVHEQDKTSYCLDMNEEFQQQGKKKIEYWLPTLKDKIKFIPHKLERDKVYPFDIEQDKTLTIGLHSCGPLSTFIVESKPKHLLNFGCCYHKMTDEFNLSTVAKAMPLSFTNHALTMAAKCMGTTTAEDVENKFSVKHFRYPIHFFYVDNMNKEEPILGNAKASDYKGDFKEYISKYCPEISKFEVPLKEKEVNYYFKAGSIRALLGRLIELYIVLDRVLYLKENDLDAKLYQFFDPKLSPRNLGIVV